MYRRAGKVAAGGGTVGSMRTSRRGRPPLDRLAFATDWAISDPYEEDQRSKGSEWKWERSEVAKLIVSEEREREYASTRASLPLSSSSYKLAHL